MRETIGLYLAGLGAAVLMLVGLLCLALANTVVPPAGLAVVGGLLAFVVLFGLRRIWNLLQRIDQDEREVQSDRSRLQALIEACPDPWCAWSDGGIYGCSPSFAQTLGLSDASRLDDVENALSASDAAALHGSFRHLRDAGQPFQINAVTANGDRILRLIGNRAEASDGTGFYLLWVRDITQQMQERDRLVEARLEIERKFADFRAAIDLLPLPVWIRNHDLAINWCNRAYAAAVEETVEKILDRQIELVRTTHGESPRDLVNRAWRTGVVQSESRFLIIGGERHLLRISEIPLLKSRMTLGYALDITRQAELKDDLERHTLAHAEVLEQVKGSVAIFGADTRLKFYNSAYADLWELDRSWLDTEPTMGEILEDLRARRKLTEQADFAAWKRGWLSQFTTLLEPLEELYHLPDGRTLWMLIAPHPFGGLLKLCEDVTNTLALESSYNTLVAVQKETLDHLAEGVAVFGGDGRLQLSNPSYVRLWALTPEDVRNHPHLSQLVERMRPLLDDGTRQWSDISQSLMTELFERDMSTRQIERTDGSTVQFTVVPLPDGAVLNSVLDVTAASRLEQALIASNAALTAADRVKTEFLHNVSYQLRTPLNALIGFAELLDNQYFGALNARQREYTAGMLEAGSRLMDMVNNIIDLTTSDAGLMVIDRHPINTAALIEGVVAATREWAEKRGLTLRSSCPPSVGQVEGDERRLRQVLVNLVSNAVKFTPSGGTVDVIAERSETEIILSVRDNGIGIAESDWQRVFGVFETSPPPIGQPGVGLGLSLVKKFIQLHGGRVSMDSRPGTGTVIRCHLPLQLPPVSKSIRLESTH